MKKPLQITLLIFAALLIGLIGACSGGGGSGSSSSGATGGSPTTPSGGGTINGLVTDFSTGVRLAGVSVTDGVQTTTTDSKGAFTLSGYSAGSAVAVTLGKAGYAPGYSNAEIGVNAAPMVLPLKKEGSLQSYNPANTTTISQTTEAGPYAVIFTPGTLNTTDPNLKVSVTPLDPTKESSVLPGNLTAAAATSTVMLAPLTFAEFSVFDSTGARVNLKPGSQAIVEMPIPPDLRANAAYQLGATIHCYSYNPTTGQWDSFVVGTIVKSSVDGSTPVLRAAIQHFSWYGGAPQSTNCIDVYGRVVSAVDGKPLPYARVEAFPGTVATSDANGNFVVVTTSTGANSFTASRTFIDTDGSVSGIVGAKVIEFGKVVDDLAGLVSRPCGSTVTPPPLPPTPPPPNITVRIGGVSLLSYQVNAYLVNGAVVAMLNESVPPNGTIGAAVSGAIMVLTGPSGPVTLTETAGAPGMYMATLATPTPGARYTLTIDADHNGSIDGTGAVNAVGTLAWTLPTNGSTYTASTFNNVAWTDSGTAVAGYSVVYYATIMNTATGVTALASYTGSALQFNPVNLVTPFGALPAGPYTASLFGFSGPYNPGSGTWTETNNITGSTVSGKFYSFGTPATANTFTLQ